MSVFVKIDNQTELDSFLDTKNSFFAYLPLNNNFVKIVETFPSDGKQKLAATYNTKFVVSVAGDAFKSFKDREEESFQAFG